MPFKLVQESYPPHLLAPKLNNRGALQLERGEFASSISTLVKALKLSEQSAYKEKYCKCHHCTLYKCLEMAGSSGRTNSIVKIGEAAEVEVEQGNHSLSQMDGEPATSPSLSDATTRDGYLYSLPLFVHPHSIANGHNMGVTLSLMIIFNLALAHHLYGIFNLKRREHNEGWTLLEKALQLYELAYQLHIDEQQAMEALQEEAENGLAFAEHEQFRQRLGMLRFTMIVSNNLGEIHRVAHNPIKHAMCLQHLLSTIMYMVDGHFLVVSTNTSTTGSLPIDELDGHETTRRSRRGGDTSRVLSPQRPHPVSLSVEELDGFLRNASVLMLSNTCAGAA